MNIVPSGMAATDLEKLSVTAKLTKHLVGWQQNEKHPKLGSLGARTVGFMVTPITAAIDLFVHTFIFTAKFLVGLFVTPYNAIAQAVNPESKHVITRELELSSALLHFCRVVENLFCAAVLPVIMLLNPNRGSLIVKQHEKIASGEEAVQALKEEHQRELQELRGVKERVEQGLSEQVDELTGQLEQKERELVEARKAPAQDAEQLKAEIKSLRAMAQGLREELEKKVGGQFDAAGLADEKAALEKALEEAKGQLKKVTGERRQITTSRNREKEALGKKIKELEESLETQQDESQVQANKIRLLQERNQQLENLLEQAPK